jgi:signal transduction histidine kinase
VRELCITIQDTGIGIDKKDQERIFEPFMRLMTTQSSKYPGSGLGLSNVKSMLEALGGKITLESVLGEGSAFTIKIPEKNP